jgi:hypothetical protein
MFVSRLIIAAAVSSCAAGALHADVVTYISANRALNASGGVNATLPGFTQSTTAVGAWDMTNFRSPAFGEPPNSSTFIGGAGRAHQATTLGGDRLFGTIDATAWDGNQGYAGAAEATLFTTFDIIAPSDFHLTGSWTAASRFSTPGISEVTHARLIFSGPTAQIIQTGTFGFDPQYTGTFDVSGTLQPGIYTLNVSTWAALGFVGSNIGGRTGLITFDLVIPAPASLSLLCVAGVIATRRRR